VLNPRRPLRLVARRPALAPTGAAVERERAMWGPNPDRRLGEIEEAFYQAGFRFLTGLYAAVMGVNPPRQLRKALGPGLQGNMFPVPDHERGAVLRAYQAGGDPLEMRNEWSRLIDRLVGRLFHQRTQEEAASAVAVHAHWLGRIRARTEELAKAPRDWWDALGRSSKAEQKAMEWTKTRALEGCKDLAENAKQGLMNVLIQSKEAGEGSQALGRRCFDACAELNRDWRRLALTETAAAHANGQLAAVDPEEGWEAIWTSAAGACPWCAHWNGQVFRVVSPDAPRKDGASQIWVGKTNIGRSGAARTRDGRPRTAMELWWAAIPCHPNCSCSWTLRRIRRTTK